jgi:hypothetical protein
MTDPFVTYKSLKKIYAAIVMGGLLLLPIGYFVADMFLPTSTWDLVTILVYFIGLPVLVSTIGFYIGWYGKKSTINYSDPTWTMEPVQMKIDEAKSLVRQNKRKYWRLVSNSSYWTFFIPIALLLFIAGLPVYIYMDHPTLGGFGPWLFAIPLSLVYVVASAGALLATSTAASEDFDILLARETIALAKAHEHIPGLSYIRVVFDKGMRDGYEIYESPRVIARVDGIEHDAYIESWTEDLHSVSRVLCRLMETEKLPQVVWWWIGTDRNYRKFVGKDEKGYYVRLPVKSKVAHPGVKDIGLVLENAVAIIILEWLETRGPNENLSQVLTELNVTPPEG